MILSYLDKDPGLEKLEKLSDIKEGKGVYTLQLAIASASLGFPTEFYSKQINFNEANLKLDFYKNYADNDRKLYEKLIEKAKDLGIEMHEKSIMENSVDCVALRQNSPDRDFGTKSNKTNQNLCIYTVASSSFQSRL